MRKDLVDAVLGMYAAIEHAANAQVAIGHIDQGRRKGITSGKHLDPVAKIIKEDLVKNGFCHSRIYDTGDQCTLPGWFRPTKKWDLLAFDDNELVGAIELKSISSSFGNNANNRAEESIGSALDAIEAYNERLLGNCNIPPVMGYVMIVRDCDESRHCGRIVRSPHFNMDSKFENASYLDRFQILCERLRRKSLYNAVWLVFADPTRGSVLEPDNSMSYEVFLETILSGLRMHQAQRRG